ncbi:Suppressor of Sensor Kinase (SLN1) [Microbotryomycetes sp. JL221]|nr:Suppressor of Sensor Kinase (SLN1) [Microbotryomycetes sp. JL221]
MPSRAPPTASAGALARANAKQASLDLANGRRKLGNNNFVGVRRAGDRGPIHSGMYDVEDDPDRLYYSRGLGQLDSDSESIDEDEASIGETSATWGDDEGNPLDNDELEQDQLINETRQQTLVSSNYYQPPVVSYDIAATPDSVDLDQEFDESQSEEGGNGPQIDERFEWQDMLSNVLQGDVLKSEKTRLSTASLSTTTRFANGFGSGFSAGNMSSRRQRAYAIWLLIRAKVRGRSAEEESRFLEEARAKVDDVMNEVRSFRVIDLQTQSNPISDEIILRNAEDQVNNLLKRIDWCESLYPSRKALMLEKEQVGADDVEARIDALRTWYQLTRRIKIAVSILKTWTGGEWQVLSAPVYQSDIKLQQAGADRGFVANIVREDSLQETFSKRLLSDIYNLVLTVKNALIDLSSDFDSMNLPGFASDLNRLAIFPSRIAQEALRNILESVAKIEDPSVVLIDQLTNDLRKGLTTACRIKKQYLDLASSDPTSNWSLPERVEEYEETLVATLRFFFKLLHWKLKSPSKAIYFKETEIVENEWGFLSEVTEQIEEGDLLVGEHFCTLTHRLLVRVLSYFETQLQVLETRDMTTTEMLRWFAQTLDNVRARHRKLLRFGKGMLQRFENSAEYSLDNVELGLFINALVSSGHFMIYTGLFEREGIYMVADPSLNERPDKVRSMIVRCFSNQTQVEHLIEEQDQAHYILLLSPRDAFIWNGRVMNLELPRMEFDLREKRVRLISDGPSIRLARSKLLFTDMFPKFKQNVLIEQKAHLARVQREIKKIGRAVFRLSETILGSLDRVRAVSKRTPGSGQELVGSYFSFAADLGQRSIRYLEPVVRNRYVLMLMKFGISWIAFICDDCVPTDPRTFKWAVQALEFAMFITRGDNILKFNPTEFALLRSKVASCMTLLISHFDILGARSSTEAKKEQERIDAARVEMKQHLAKRFAQLQSSCKTLQDYEQEEPDDGIGTLGAESLGTLREACDRRLEALAEVDQQRAEVEKSTRMVGRVLNRETAEENALAFLASSSSNISIRWQQGKYIGAGTFGTVYLAVNLDSGEELAVKEIRFQALANAPHLIKTVRDEMKVMEMLRHENIVQYYGIEVHRDKVYIFEEYCPGGSLANLLEHGPIQEELIVQLYALQMLNGLVYLHSQNVVHRDIKPDNILLDANGTIKFVDFGAAKVLVKGQKTLAGLSRMAAQGKGHFLDAANGAIPGAEQNSLTGTPMYLSPETVKGERRGKKGAMDVWAVGCVILECVTGHRPWSNLDNEWAIMFTIGIASQHPPLPSRDQLSELGIEFLRAALTIDPDDRPTASDLLDHPWIKDFREQLAAMNEEESQDSNSSRGGYSPALSRAGTSSLASTNATTLFEEDEEGEQGQDQAEVNGEDTGVEDTQYEQYPQGTITEEPEPEE